MKAFVIFLTLFISVVGHTSNYFTLLEKGKEFYKLGLNVEFLEDQTGRLTLDDIHRPEWKGVTYTPASSLFK